MIHRLGSNHEHNFLSKTAFPIAKNDVFDHKKSFWQSYVFVWDRKYYFGRLEALVTLMLTSKTDFLWMAIIFFMILYVQQNFDC